MVLRIKATLAPRSVTREHLEYPLEYVNFAYLSAINRIKIVSFYTVGSIILSNEIFTDKSILGLIQVNEYGALVARLSDYANFYQIRITLSNTTSDFEIAKLVSEVLTLLAYEAIDLDTKGRAFVLGTTGSVVKGMRYELTRVKDPLNMGAPDATVSATDTTHASGYFGFRTIRVYYPHSHTSVGGAWLMPPASPGPEAKVILEVEVEGDGSPRNPYRSALVKELVEITPDLNIPDFLKEEKKKYDILKAKGFTDEEMELLLGYKPQTHIDIASITVGSFEFNHESPTNIITVFDTNPYDPKAIEKQIEMARAKNLKIFTPGSPWDIKRVEDIYRELSREYKHWLAGKDNFLYQVTGLEIFDILQNVDFYYGHLLEHKRGYKQLKMVPDWEIERRLTQLEEKLTRITELTDERDKHLAKLREIKKKGW